jgi:hypothetical protein
MSIKGLVLGIMGFSILALNTYYISHTPVAHAQAPTEKPANQRVTALKAVVDRYTTHLEKVIDRSENLLDKVQTRTVKAKAAGENTVELERLMNESRARIASAEGKLNEIEEMKTTATTKANFTSIRDRFKSVKIDLQLVRKNTAEMIKALK